MKAMNIGSWLLIAGLFWILGYSQIYLLEPSPFSKLVYVPNWLFILFGSPKHQEVPAKVMRARSVYLQLMGIIMALYGLLLDQKLERDPSLSGLFGFIFSMLISGLVTTYLSKKRPYIWHGEFKGNE